MSNGPTNGWASAARSDVTDFAQKIADTIREPLLVLDSNLRVVFANPAFYDVFKVRKGKTEGELVYELGNSQWDIPALRQLLEDILPKDETFNDYRVEHEFERIGSRTMLLNARRLHHEKLILLAIQDITEAEAERQSERRAKLLLAELQHRVRNTLAVVRSIARRTAESSDTVEQMISHFEGRLNAFARVQSAVTRNENGVVDLHAIIDDELLALATREGDRLHIAGPTLWLEARAAESISLAIHELATNSVKYGALMQNHGRVAIEWHCTRANGAGGQLDLEWTETGLREPPNPSHEGFGHELLLRTLPYDLTADTSIDFNDQGMRFTMRMQLKPDVVAGEMS